MMWTLRRFVAGLRLSSRPMASRATLLSPRGGISRAAALAILLMVVADAPAVGSTTRELITAPGITEVHTATQNWTDQEARTFYNVAQGSKLNGRVSEITSRENLKLEELGRVLEQDSASFDDPGRFLSRDGIRSAFSLVRRAKTEVATSGAGTRVRFAEPVAVGLPYKGRPLNGIWATAPFLHNGSVPNLDELLKPPAERISKFRIGSREFDPVKVGFVSDGEFEFDTRLPGNSNYGHTYGNRIFSKEERQQLIEYMKSL